MSPHVYNMHLTHHIPHQIQKSLPHLLQICLGTGLKHYLPIDMFVCKLLQKKESNIVK